jgi:hypothetical protein
MSDERERARRLADELIDYAIYAPLGAAISLAEELPELVRRGRERFGTQVKLAQVIGKVAVDSARRQAEGFVRGSSRPRPANEKPVEEAKSSGKATPFPDYDDLGAAEVISRLASLLPEELHIVRAYEELHRARRTVLGKISQLLDERKK